MKFSRRRWAGVAVTAVIVAFGAAYTVTGHAHEDDDDDVILAFSTMRGNMADLEINNNVGGFAPWVIADGDGVLTTGGEVRIRVRGLVFDPSVPNVGGTNPFPAFRAIVSCTTVDANGDPAIVNITTGGFPADKNGNCRIHDRVTLPDPCYAPAIFIGPEPKQPPAPDTVIPGGTWFAVTGF